MLERTQQGGDVAWIVLQIGVHRHDAPAAHGAEAGVGGRRFTCVGLEPHEAHARIGLAQAADDLGAPVAAAVVDEHDLEDQPLGVEHRLQLRPQHRETVLLVVDGDHHREVDHRAEPRHSATSVCGRLRRSSTRATV